ncbi:diguanylate cyclase (GGDEF)-like protein [Stella humosa]|uniref:diguanylate cyclase n=1 Tax=Stella humosa TaxID=94 RepID=A0A3N1KXX7_9PROT|nr:diguanylate cyclase [Stella humosa]ROP84282.1 diguanylate cyclase (GGDEF)-like protein [Stella humosa]BBK33795.1 hypothetical protein STHU_44290 [Stella humosa]
MTSRTGAGGRTDAAVARLRQELARRIVALLDSDGLSPATADAGAGNSAAQLDRIRRGKAADTDLEHLIRLLLRVAPDMDIAISVVPAGLPDPVATRLPEASEPEEIRSVFERTLDLLPDGVLLIGPERTLVYANKAFEQLWQMPAGLVQSGDQAALLRHAMEQIEDPAAFQAEVERLYGSHERTQDFVSFKDGRIMSRRSVPFMQAERDHGRIWIFTDVTEAWHARRDPLTGIPNRRAYARRFPDFVLRPDDGLLKGMAIIDVDHFKGYNDRYGHAAGDSVLVRIAEALSTALGGEDDELFRIGGEEFVVIGKHRSADGAGAMFERLRAAIERLRIEHPGNPGGVVTASFGVALFRGSMNPGSIFELADQCLYRSKQAGRNRVTQERIRRRPADDGPRAATSAQPAARP